MLGKKYYFIYYTFQKALYQFQYYTLWLQWHLLFFFFLFLFKIYIYILHMKMWLNLVPLCVYRETDRQIGIFLFFMCQFSPICQLWSVMPNIPLLRDMKPTNHLCQTATDIHNGPSQLISMPSSGASSGASSWASSGALVVINPCLIWTFAWIVFWVWCNPNPNLKKRNQT